MPQQGKKSPGSGGRPTPTAILQARGSWRAKVRARTEPQVDPGLPECPLPLHGEAQRTWERMCAQLSAVGILSTIDGTALARYCELWARWCALASSADLDHLITMLRISEHLLKIEVQYGLTPASRPNVHRLETSPHGNSGPKKDLSRFFTPVSRI
jgi:phage terminase small subunit